MADSATLVGLLDKADNAFALAGDIGVAFVREQSYRSSNPPPAQADWQQRQEWLIEAGRNLNQLQTSLRELQDAIQRPPAGFEDVAEQLRQVTKLALHCYQDGRVEIVRILEAWFLFHETSEAGREIVSKLRGAVRREGLAAILHKPMSVPPGDDGRGDGLRESGRSNAYDGQEIAAVKSPEPNGDCSTTHDTGESLIEPADAATKVIPSSNGAEGNAKQASQSSKRRGRPKADYATVQHEAKTKANWERAREASPPTPKLQFASDNGYTSLEDFDAMLDRVYQREKAMAREKSRSE